MAAASGTMKKMGKGVQKTLGLITDSVRAKNESGGFTKPKKAPAPAQTQQGEATGKAGKAISGVAGKVSDIAQAKGLPEQPTKATGAAVENPDDKSPGAFLDKIGVSDEWKGKLMRGKSGKPRTRKTRTLLEGFGGGMGMGG